MQKDQLYKIFTYIPCKHLPLHDFHGRGIPHRGRIYVNYEKYLIDDETLRCIS